jgi:hypothetical protein
MPTRPLFAPALGLLLLAGCGEKQPAFPDVHPVRGVVKVGGKPAAGGSVRFDADPAVPGYIISGPVGPDGAFTLTTVRTTDKVAERKPGAPAGAYRVTYMPPAGDQTAGPPPEPPVLPKPVTVEAKENDLTLDFPGR